MNKNAGKIGWTTALITIGWILVFLPVAEDGVPDKTSYGDRNFWTVWIIINIVALVAVHLWISEEERHARRTEKQYFKDLAQSRRDHPTYGNG